MFVYVKCDVSILGFHFVSTLTTRAIEQVSRRGQTCEGSLIDTRQRSGFDRHSYDC